MSVYAIYVKNGTKFMNPVTDMDAYLALRNSDQNRRAEKRNMVQMNYSCLPNADGSLRGSTRTSSTVGMDVDLDEAANAQEKETHQLREHILDLKEELGLLMLEESATKGYHVVFRRREELSQEENLKWASELLGVEYDKGAKDITRVFYTPADKLIFLDEELFEVRECVSGAEAATAIGTAIGTAAEASSSVNPEFSSSEPLCSEASSSEPSLQEPLLQDASQVLALQAARYAFDLCVTQAGLSAEQMDVWGEHNWHSNLMAVLSVGLPKLMSRDMLLRVVCEKLPHYSTTDDCRKLIGYFYEKYTADTGFMSGSLRDINAKAQRMASEESLLTPEQKEEEKLLSEVTSGWAPPELPKKLPHMLELLVNNYDKSYEEMLLLTALPILSAHASHFRARYLNGRVIGCQQFVAIIGGSGSGKSLCTRLFQDMVKKTLDANDLLEWEKVRENAEQRDEKSNSNDKPKKYHPRLRLFETASKSSILELQTNLGKNGMLLGQFSEADGLQVSSGSSFSNISVILRKGWDGDMHRQFYMSESTCNTYTNMNISLLMAGTVKAMLERMFSDNNCESGLMQRFIPVLVPKKKRTFRPPVENILSEEERKERDQLLMELFQKDLALGDEVQELDLPLTCKAIGEWFDELEERYNDGLLTEAEADLSHRCGEFMLRAAIPLVALYGKETKEIVEFSRWVGEMAHYILSRLFGARVQKDITSANELLSERMDGRCTAEPLLDKLPAVFTVKDMQKVRVESGQSADVKVLLTRYCKNGKLERVGRGVYRKAHSV